MPVDDEDGPPPAPAKPLSRFRAQTAMATARGLIDTLLEGRDPAAAVAALSVPELFYLVKEVGLSDCLEIIALATPEQVQGAIDMEAWDRDRIQMEGIAPWLSALLEAGAEKITEIWRGLDTELVALVVGTLGVVHDLTLTEDNDPVIDESYPVYQTPDGFFAVEIHGSGGEDESLLPRLLDNLYQVDGDLARHTLMSARSEMPSYLEEMSYRWRTGRMADHGYSDFHEALVVFSPLAPEQVRIGEGTAEGVSRADRAERADRAGSPRPTGGLPMLLARPLAGASFLARALDRITDGDELTRLEQAVLLLVNRVLAASRVSPGDLVAARAGAGHTADTLSLGLETVARGDLDAAVEALRTVSLTRLHRAGHTVTLRLARLARALAPRAVDAGSEAEALLSALLGARPWFPRRLDDPPAGGVRAFASTADVRTAARELALLGLRVAVATDLLGVDLIASRELLEPPALDDHARTALARALGGGELRAAPLSPGEVAAARSRVGDGRLDAAAATAARDGLLALADKAELPAREYLPSLIDSWLAEITSELPDDRFITRLRTEKT